MTKSKYYSIIACLVLAVIGWVSVTIASMDEETLEIDLEIKDPEFDTYQAHVFNIINYTDQYDGQGVRLGLVDSGVYSQHEDLKADKILKGYNYISDDPSDMVDYTGHGTFIAGIIGGQRNNGLGISGLVPEVEILPLKCFDKSLETQISVVVQCIEKAIEAQVDVLNLSFTTPTPSSEFENIINKAVEQGMIIVAPSGNDGSGTLYYPASYDRVISVNAVEVTHVGAVVCESHMSNPNVGVTVSAPGSNLLSLSHIEVDGYKQRSGTSYATAIVASAAVMAKQHDPSMDFHKFVSLLEDTGTDYGVAGYDTTFGHGLINIESMFNN